MYELPDLDRPSVAEKDDLIRAQHKAMEALTKQVEAMAAQIETLTVKVRELEGRLALNSRNSSKPPSSGGYGKPSHGGNKAGTGGKKSGGQKGHPGTTLKKSDQPDHVVVCPAPTQCERCQARLPQGGVETRQVFDMPLRPPEVTEYQVVETCCGCGKVHRGEFPPGVSGPVQYGPNIKAAVVHLTHHHMMPVARTGAQSGDLFGLPLSDATVLAINAEAKSILAPIVANIGETLKTVPLAHTDETGMHVSAKLYWVHVVATTLLTWIGCHAKRGRQAIDAFGILTTFVGTLVHDGWKTYRDLACTHALCNAHHVRELTFVFEEKGQAWAHQLIELLIEALGEVKTIGGPLPNNRSIHYRSQYAQILAEGDRANPRAPPTGARGRAKQNKARNLIDRLNLYADDVWRFTTDHGVPFSNNVAEHVMRMQKVKEKISGGFRTLTGLETFCVIRSYLATLHKQGTNAFIALTQVFQGNPVQSRFA
jgi:transposase